MQIGKVKLTTERPESLTQAYYAGQILAMLENYFPTIRVPSYIQFLLYPHAIRELLGERSYQKICNHHKLRDRVRAYEALTYQPQLPASIRGTYREFFLGYVKAYENSNLRKQNNKSINEQEILNYLQKN